MPAGDDDAHREGRFANPAGAAPAKPMSARARGGFLWGSQRRGVALLASSYTRRHSA